jgi:hypothetical protein
MTPVDPSVGVQEMLRAIENLAMKCSTEDRAGEAADYAHAALFFAQAIVTLDPGLGSNGENLADQQTHETQLEQIKQEGENERARMRQATELQKSDQQARVQREQARAQRTAPTSGTQRK